MKNKYNIKVLPLQHWMKYTSCYKDLIPVPPLFNRNGYYLIKNKFCWFEFNGKAYKYDPSAFKYELYILNAENFREIELKAIKILVDNKLADKNLLNRYFANRDMMDIRKVVRDSRKKLFNILLNKE